MGTRISHEGSSFSIAERDHAPALSALQAFVADQRRPADVALDPPAVARATTLDAALAAAGFTTDRSPAGDLTALRWSGEELPRDTDTLQRLLQSLAPFVREGSWLKLREDGDEEPCRFVYRRGRVRRQTPRDEADEMARRHQDAHRAIGLGEVVRGLAILAELELPDGSLDDRARYLRESAWDSTLAMLSKEARWLDLAAVCGRAPNPADAWSNALSDAQSRGDLAAAYMLGRRALASNPTDSSARRSLIHLCDDVSRYDEALALLTALPPDEQAQFASLRRAWLAALGRHDEALPLARDIAAASNDPTDVAQVADVLENLGRDDEARIERARALDLHRPTLEADPTSSSAWARHAWFLLHVGRLDEARSLAERAESASPSSYNHWLLAELALARDDPAAAVAHCEAYLARSPYTDPVHAAYALALARSGQLPRAREVALRVAALSAKQALRLRREPLLAPALDGLVSTRVGWLPDVPAWTGETTPPIAAEPAKATTKAKAAPAKAKTAKPAKAKPTKGKPTKPTKSTKPAKAKPTKPTKPTKATPTKPAKAKAKAR